MAARRNRNALARQPDGRREVIVQTVEATVERFQGPLPAPEVLARYDEIVPGMAERLLVTFEQQTQHRQSLERTVIEGDVKRADLGLRLGAGFGVLVLGAALVLILNGHESAGVITILIEFLVYGGLFLYGSESRRRERSRKAGG